MTNETIRLNCMALRGIVLFPGTMEHFDVGRPKSLKAIMNAHQNDDRVFVVCQKNPDDEDPSFRQLYDMGCLIEIKQVMSLPDGTVRVLAMPLSRARMLSLWNDGEVLTAEVEIVPPDEDDDERLQAALKLARQEYEHYLDLKGETGGETRQMLLAQSRAGAFSDKLAANVIEGYSDKQSVLEAVDPLERTILVCAYLHRESENLLLMQDVQRRVQSRMERSNREYFLREQQRVIDEELGEEDDEAAGYEKKLASLPMNDEARERTAKEIKRLKRATPQSPEAAIMENYIEYMLELPWGKYDKTLLSIPKARKVLEKDHYGLEEVKKRILEYLAVRSVKQDAHSPILCLVGAPGVGKTSIARSVARALGKRFCQVSLGGVHDEAELRGHRRTYVAAMPGRVISAIKQCGSMDPVFLFDEIDKMASDMRGDPAAAMLEILDPEQNARFRDHYLEAPFDLSRVLFITTANTLEAIPRPLFDRMELIEVPSYTVEEKVQIAKRHLWPKQLEENGMSAKQLKISDQALTQIIEGYTAEAGVRSLERALGRVIRKVLVERLEQESDAPALRITPALLQKYLGAPRHLKPDTAKKPEVGIVNGLAWTSIGGVVMPIEVSVLPGSGALELTGSLGAVMKESAHIALSFVRAHMQEDGVSEEFRKSHDIHVHVPEGATPKDGPSAGIAMACAIYSALAGLEARQDVAMTGEISLRGKALPIGGVKEKLLAAYRLGINNILLPKENMKDLEEIPSGVLEKLNVIPITSAMEALSYVLPGKKG